MIQISRKYRRIRQRCQKGECEQNACRGSDNGGDAENVGDEMTGDGSKVQTLRRDALLA